MENIPLNPTGQELVTVCDIQFRTGTKVYFFDPLSLEIKAGDDVIIDTARGPEFGKCVRGNHSVMLREIVAPLRPVIRLATPQDKRIDAENRQREKHAYEVCLQKIAELKLDMQLVSTEYAFDGSKILFFFTADGRVDFRELVKSLASVLRTRIELRQIGVRDKAKMVGGLGICGRPFCCREFLDDFQPVSIKMAKTQNLSLNPTKISGTCGRLMCCLNYEQEAYEDLLRTSPKPESFVDTPDGRGTVTEVNLLRQSVRVRLEKQPDNVVCHKNCDICVLRNGKAKKTDEPIPDDLAPISGGKPKKRQDETSFSTYLEPVVLRKDASTIAPLTTSEEDDAADELKKKRRRRGGKNRKPAAKAEPAQDAPAPKAEKPAPKAEKAAPKAEKPAPRADKAAKPEKPAPKAEKAAKEPEAEGGETQKPKSGNHHHYYRKRRKSGGNKPEA